MDNYRLLRSIGRGAFGNVTLYERLSDHKQVVIKQIPVYPMEESEEEVTHNEVQVISKLSHPLIIDYYGSFIENMTLNIVMEYAAGGTMSDYLKERQGKLMAQQEVLHLFTQIMLALRHIHSNNVVHRDLTTKNIFLCGKKHIIKVGDFGLSKILESRSKASSVVGTPNYLSPELCEGQEYNQKCDMWALGCVLYEMLTLNKAFDAPSLTGIITKIMRGSYLPVDSSLYDNCVKDLLTSLLHHNPQMRPSVASLMTHPAVLVPLYSLYANLGRITPGGS